MNIELNQFGATLAAGAYALLCIGAVLELASPGITASLRRVERGFAGGAVAAVLAFACGIVVERGSDWFAEPDIRWLEDVVLDDDESIRAEVLYKRLGHEFVALGSPDVFEVLGGPSGPDVRRRLESGGIDPRRPTAEQVEVASRIYYEARSAAYGRPTYFDDLMLIQTHIRFIRSIAVASFFGVGFGVLAWLLRWLALPLAARPSPRAPGLARAIVVWFAGRTLDRTLRRHVKRLAAALIVLVPMYLLTRFTFAREEENFDKRAFGCYLHLLRTGELKLERVVRPLAGVPFRVRRTTVALRSEDSLVVGGVRYPVSYGSGIAYDGERDGWHGFLMLTDRGPTYDGPRLVDGASSRATSILLDPEFEPAIAYVRWQAGAQAAVVETLPLRLGGRAARGVPSRPSSAGDRAVRLSADGARLVALDPAPQGIDPEGVAYEPWTSEANARPFWICEEDRPAILRVDPFGNASRPLTPEDGGVPRALARREAGRGLEGIAIADGVLFVAMQSACMAASADRLEPWIRIARCDLADAVAAVSRDGALAPAWDEFAYPIPEVEGAGDRNCMLSDLAALDRHCLVLIERRREEGGERRRVCVVDLQQTSATGVPGLAFVERVPILDLERDLGWRGHKPEGICMIDERTLVLCSDSDFGLAASAAVVGSPPAAPNDATDAIARRADAGEYVIESGPGGAPCRIEPRREAGTGETAFWVVELPAPIRELRDAARGKRP